MASVYSKAPEKIAERAAVLLEKNHFELFNHDLHIDFIFANATLKSDGTSTGPALTHAGYAALAMARICSTKDRVMGRGDCEVVIDADRWPQMSEAEQDAVLDHELEHFMIAKDKYGEPLTDDIDRPKLKLKKHDHQFGWFDDIARRHGLAAPEVRQFQELCYCDAGGQFYLPHIGIPEDDHVAVKKTIVSCRKSLKAPVKEFVQKMQGGLGEGGSVEITSKGKGVKITKDAVTPVG